MTDAKAQDHYSFEELMSCARGEMYGPGNAQLPAPPMLLFNRITKINDDGGRHGKGYIEAEFDIDPSLWFFDCHFIGDPVMPGSLGLDALWQLVGFYLGWIGGKGSGRALGCGEARFGGGGTPQTQTGTSQGAIKRAFHPPPGLGVGRGGFVAPRNPPHTAAQRPRRRP